MESLSSDNAAGRSRWEWLPLAALVVMALVYWRAAPGSAPARFSAFVGLGLIPGLLWTAAGRSPWNVHRVCFALALIAFVLVNPELRPDGGTLAKMAENWGLVAAGMLVSFSQSLFGTLRIQRLLTDSGVAIGKYASLKLCLIGSFFNILLPGSTGGDAYRVYAITRGYRTRLAPAIASVTLDRFLGLPSLILVVAMGMLVDYEFFRSSRVLSGLIPFISAAGALCLALVAYLALAGKSHRRAVEPVQEGTRGRLGRIHAMVATNVKRPATLPLALLHGFLAHLACIVSCLLFGLALEVAGVPGERYFLIVPLAMAINAIPGAPGGVGQGELAMATLLDMAGPGLGNAQMGVMIMLLFRLSNIAVGIAGGVYYALDRKEGAGGAFVRDYEEARRESSRMFAGGEGGEWR